MWRKNINLTSPDYEEKVWHCSKQVGAVGMTPSNPQWIPPKSSSSLPDKVNIQFCVYNYESPKQTWANPNAVDLTMDLLLSRPANTGQEQPLTHLKSWISANTTDTSAKVKLCIGFLLFNTKLCYLHGMI